MLEEVGVLENINMVIYVRRLNLDCWEFVY